MTKRVVRIRLGDGSDLLAWYEHNQIVELYHELPMEGTPPTASMLTNISAMIPAVNAGGLLAGVRSEIYVKIFNQGS